MDIKDAVTALESLAHETRLGVFRLLVQAGPDGLSAGDISDQLGALQNTMSSHLQKLGRAGIVHSRRDGRHIIYSANFAALSGLILYLMDDCCGGSAEVCNPVAAKMNC
jgi:DNA-binding transcriptional ArsR family regulator